MPGIEQENKKLREENEKLKDEEHKKTVALKLIAFIGIVGLSGYVQSFSTIAALIIGFAGFYLCFMR